MIVTHQDVDHAGTAEVVRSRAGAAIYVGAEDAPLVRGAYPSHPPHGSWRESWRPSVVGYPLHGASVGGARYRPVATVTTPDEDGPLDVPGRWTCRGESPTPGHTAGHRPGKEDSPGVGPAGEEMVVWSQKRA